MKLLLKASLELKHMLAHYKNVLKDLTVLLRPNDIKLAIKYLKAYKLRRFFSLIDNQYIEFNFNKRSVKFKLISPEDLFTIYQIFFKGLYEPLNVAGKTVLDIGAYIGDSSIYFALKGAKKVIAVEPDKRAFEHLIYNINCNNLHLIIEPLNIALTDPSDLENLISSLNTSVVVKIDCEGCEYKILQESLNPRVLDMIEELMLEYHRQYGDALQLIVFLRKHYPHVYVKAKSRRLGTIYAKHI